MKKNVYWGWVMARDKRLIRAEKVLQDRRRKAASAVGRNASREVVHTAMAEYSKALRNRDAAEVMVRRSRG